MTEQRSEFNRQVAHQILFEKKILSSFTRASIDDIVSALKSVLSVNSKKYARIIEMIEAAGLGNDEIFEKWKSIEGRLNAEAFGIVDWSVLLDELAQNTADQNELLEQTAGERAQIRKKIPTSIVKSTPMDSDPLPLILTSLPELGSVSTEGEATDPGSRGTPPPPAPESKEQLVRQIEALAAEKRQALAELHEEQSRVIREHEEKLIHDSKQRALERIDQLERLKSELKGLIGSAETSSFESRLSGEMEQRVDREVETLTRQLSVQIESIRAKSRDELKKAQGREREVLARLEEQIQQARQTYDSLEHSGLFSVKGVLGQAPSGLSDPPAVLEFLTAAQKEIIAEELPDETLKLYRDRSMLYLREFEDEAVQRASAAVLSALVFSSLEGQSKGKIISQLIRILDGCASNLAAGSLAEIARDERFVFRLSEEDAAHVARLIQCERDDVRRAVILLLANQLYLARNGVIPKLSKKLSRQLQNELINTFAEDREAPIIAEIRDLGYIQSVRDMGRFDRATSVD